MYIYVHPYIVHIVKLKTKWWKQWVQTARSYQCESSQCSHFCGSFCVQHSKCPLWSWESLTWWKAKNVLSSSTWPCLGPVSLAFTAHKAVSPFLVSEFRIIQILLTDGRSNSQINKRLASLQKCVSCQTNFKEEFSHKMISKLLFYLEKFWVKSWLFCLYFVQLHYPSWFYRILA